MIDREVLAASFRIRSSGVDQYISPLLTSYVPPRTSPIDIKIRKQLPIGWLTVSRNRLIRYTVPSSMTRTVIRFVEFQTRSRSCTEEWDGLLPVFRGGSTASGGCPLQDPMACLESLCFVSGSRTAESLGWGVQYTRLRSMLMCHRASLGRLAPEGAHAVRCGETHCDGLTSVPPALVDNYTGPARLATVPPEGVLGGLD